MDLTELMEAAASVRLRAYAPYSKFRVGAAVELADHAEVFVGCNVENASFGLTICAERMAIGAAIAQVDLQQHPPIRIVVMASPRAAPCGACRQFLAEFGLQLMVYAVDAEDHQQLNVYKISDLLPNRFTLG